MEIEDAKVKCPACGWKGELDDAVQSDSTVPLCPVCLCNVIMERITLIERRY